MVAKGGGLIFEGKCIFENKPPPQSRSCLLLKKGGGGGLFSGGYGMCKKKQVDTHFDISVRSITPI